MVMARRELIDYTLNLIHRWTPTEKGRIELLLSNCDILVSINGSLMELEIFVKKYDIQSPKGGFQRAPVKSSLEEISNFIRERFGSRFENSELISLEWTDSSQFRPKRRSKEVIYLGNTYLIDDSSSLGNYSLLDDTLASPFCCIGRDSPALRWSNPIDDAYFVVLDAFDETAFVLFSEVKQ